MRALRWIAIAFVAVVLVWAGDRVTSLSRVIVVRTLAEVTANDELVRSATVTVMAYNIAHGRGAEPDQSNFDGGSASVRRARLDAIAGLIRRNGAAVVVLNEVDFDAVWSGGVDQAEYLATKAGYPYLVQQRNIDVGLAVVGLRFGNAILSKLPLADCEVIDLPSYSTFETVVAGKKRGVVCSLAAADPFRVAAVHLEHRSEASRAEAAEVINKLAGRNRAPLIVLGDINSTRAGFPGARPLADGRTALDVLATKFSGPPLSVPTSAALTFPSTNPRFFIDWILCDSRPVVGRRTIPSVLSDHRPVIANVVLRCR